jgi:hypothetical protein
MAPADGSASGDEVVVEGRAFSNIPERRSKPYLMTASENGDLVFNEDSPEGDETLVDDLDDEGKRITPPVNQ